MNLFAKQHIKSIKYITFVKIFTIHRCELKKVIHLEIYDVIPLTELAENYKVVKNKYINRYDHAVYLIQIMIF
jgi:hypothetical protein